MPCAFSQGSFLVELMLQSRPATPLDRAQFLERKIICSKLQQQLAIDLTSRVSRNLTQDLQTLGNLVVCQLASGMSEDFIDLRVWLTICELHEVSEPTDSVAAQKDRKGTPKTEGNWSCA